MHLRFHAPGLEPGDQSAVLSAEESGHAVRVLRVRPGTEIRVFNGRGYECSAVVESAVRGVATVRIVAEVAAQPEPRVAIALAQAVLKGDRMDEVIRDAVMLGVREVVPVVSAHAEASLPQLLEARRHERWQRVAVSSAKQCGRAVVPVVRPPAAFGDVVASAAADLRLLLTEPALSIASRTVEGLASLPCPASAAVLVGPEGGWDPGEVEAAAAAGWTPLSIGARTLRADAAASVAIPVLQYLWGDL